MQVLLPSLLLLLSALSSANEKAAIENAAVSEDVPVELLSAICFVESSHRSTVVNKNDGGSDSIGLCQVKYETAKQMGFIGNAKDLSNAFLNSIYAAKYLRHQLSRYGSNWLLAISAYNAGTAKRAASGAPVNKDYVNKVLQAIIDGK